MYALVEVLYAALRPLDGRQAGAFEVCLVDGQLRCFYLGAKGSDQLCAEIAAQLLLHQRFFLLLGGLCHQQEQRHAGEHQS